MAILGQPYNQSLSATGGLRPYSWSATGTMPPGLTLFGDGTITGVPTSTGAFNLVFTVADARSSTATQAITLIVAPPVSDLAITSLALPQGVIGQPYSQPLKASGGVPPYKWAVQALPAPLKLDADSGTISGTPANIGVYGLTIAVTDAVKSTVTATVILKITSGANPQVSITTPPPLFTGVIGQPYLQSFGASGGTPPYTWSILSGDTDGLTLDAANGVLQGAPTAAGSFAFVLQVTDTARATATQSYTLTVTGPPMTVTVGGSLPSGTVGVSYSQRLPLTVSGGTPPYSWSLSPAEPAPGLQFTAADQTIAGTPAKAGTFNITVVMTDSATGRATRGLTLTIAAGLLSITSDRQLPDGQLNQPYTFTAAAGGGQQPYRWSASGLPAGLSVNSGTGEISGTPTAGGAFPIAITVVDSALTVVSDRFTLNVRMPAAPSVTLSGLPATTPAAAQFPLQVAIDAPYPAAITGEAALTFAADSGPVDRTVQFASGGTSATFTIPAGSTTAVSGTPLAVQTGTAAGTITISVRLQAGGIDLTPSAALLSSRIMAGAPVIGGVQVARKADGFTIAVSGYSTAREVTQAVFTFKAAAGQTLQSAATSISIPVGSLFGPWFQDPANSQYGTQFVYAQPFTVQGDASAVLPDTVTITNQLGSATFKIAQ